MIHEEICTCEVCKLAKEKGFPQQYDSLTHIYGGKDSFNVGIDLKYKKCEGTLFDISEWNPCLNDIAAPIQSLLQRWLREEKRIHMAVFPNITNTFKFYYIVYNKSDKFWKPIYITHSDSPLMNSRSKMPLNTHLKI